MAKSTVKIDEKNRPQHWSDLPEELQRALIKAGKERLWWEGLFARLGAFSKVAQILLTIAAFFAVVRSGAVEWIAGFTK